MQFNVRTQVLGINRSTIEGRTFCSFFTGQPSQDAESTRGLEVTKLSAEPPAFDQIPQEFQPGDELELICILKRAAQGKSQPHIVGVVPVQASPKAPTSQKSEGK